MEGNILKILLADPLYDENEFNSVIQVIKSGWLTQGKKVSEFEESFAKYIGVKHAIAVFNGTAALHTALAALGVDSGDEVIVPSFSFIATANSLLYQGAKPVFADIDPVTLNLDPADVEKKMSYKTRGIIPVHYGGLPADMDSFVSLARKHNLFVLEDAAEAVGSIYRGKKVGAIGTVGIFSFHAQKVITTGEGGMITTNDDELAEKCRIIRNHGRDIKTKKFVRLGYNYRMTEIQAAIGIEQVNKIEQVIDKRRRNAVYLTKNLKDIKDLFTPYEPDYSRHTYMLYTVKIDAEIKRGSLQNFLRDRGIESKVYFNPLHLEPFYRTTGYSKCSLPRTEEMGKKVLSLPVHAKLSKNDLNHIIDSINLFFH